MISFIISSLRDFFMDVFDSLVIISIILCWVRMWVFISFISH
jgi:hypothetical protein